MSVRKAAFESGSPHEQDVAGLDAHVVEGELGLARGAQAHLLVGAGDAHALGLEVHDDGADPLGALAAGEATPHEARPRLVAAGDVVLVGVEPVAVAVGRESGPHVADGRTGLGLGDADAEEGLARSRPSATSDP